MDFYQPTEPTRQSNPGWLGWYIRPIKKWWVFRGRASRKEYWIFTGTNILIAVILVILEAALFPSRYQTFWAADFFVFVILAPSIAVMVRRFHDTNRSAWWLLMGLIPFIGGIIQLVALVSPGNPGPNRYGPNPYRSDQTYCHQCGSLVLLGQNFCSRCGTRLEPPSAQDYLA